MLLPILVFLVVTDFVPVHGRVGIELWSRRWSNTAVRESRGCSAEPGKIFTGAACASRKSKATLHIGVRVQISVVSQE